MRVVLVDDNSHVRDAMGSFLRSQGLSELFLASTGKEALRLIYEQLPDVVILDVNLPDLSGFEVCRIIKSSDRTRAIPVIHISGERRLSSDKIEGLSTGCDAYLTNPINPQELLATMYNLVRRSSRERDAEDRLQVALKNFIETDRLSHLGLQLAEVVHNLKSPLHVISGAVAEMDHDGISHPFMPMLKRASTSIGDYITVFLERLHPDSGGISEVHINELIESETRFRLSASPLGPSIRVVRNYTHGLPAVKARHAELSQVFGNILVNAIEAIGERNSIGAMLEIRTREDDGFVRVDISDSGGGMSSENLKRYGDAFFSTKKAETSGENLHQDETLTHSGTGLGASYVKRIIGLYGGRVEVSSTPGLGTTVSVFLPKSKNL